MAAIGRQRARHKAGETFRVGSKPAGGVSGDMGWQSRTYAVKDKAGKVVETGSIFPSP